MLTDFPHRIANLADPAPDYPWPEGYRSAVFPAFDVDAETAWLNYDAKNTDRLVTLGATFFEGQAAGAGRTPPSASGPVPGPSRAEASDIGAVYNGHTLTAPLSPYELKAGAIIPAVLLTGVDTARAGPVVATVSQNVYDTVSGRHLVLPQGTRLIGRHEGESAYGDRRAFRVRLTPHGRASFVEMAQQHESWIVEAFEGLSPRDLDSLHKLLGKVKQHQLELNQRIDEE